MLRALESLRMALAGAMLLSLGGCGDDPPGAVAPENVNSKRGYIAFVGAGPDDPLWPVLEASAKRQLASAATMGVRFLNPTGNAPSDQVELLKNLHDRDFRGLCIHLRNVEALTPALASLHSGGIPIVSMMQPAPPELRAGHVGLDETSVGHDLAQGTAKELVPADSTIMLLHAGYDHALYGARYMAFMEQIKQAGHIALLAEFNCHADPREARRIMQERSERYPRLSAWVSLADWPSEGASSPDEFLRSGTRYITFGGLPHQWSLVRKGISPCLVGADYSQIGGRALQLCESTIRDPVQTDRVVHIPTRTITPANLDEYVRDWSLWARCPSN